MKNLAVICIIGVLFSACQKQKNVDEFEQFKGKWKLNSPGLGGKTKNVYTIGSTITTYYDFDNTKELILEFENDGYISFKNDKFGKETWRIIDYKVAEINSALYLGYELSVKNKYGKKYKLFLSRNIVTNEIVSEMWYKNQSYSNSSNRQGGASTNQSSTDYFEKYGKINYEYYYLGWYEKI
jgi:hypothetical protein